MKITKRLISIVLCLCVICSLTVAAVAGTDSVPALDTTGAYIDFVSEPVKAGEVAELTMTMNNNPKIWGIILTFDYGDVLTPVTVEDETYGILPKVTYGTNFANTKGTGDNGSMGEAGFDNVLVSPISDGKFTYLYTNTTSSANSKNGDMATFYFNVPENTPVGEYVVEIVDYDQNNFINQNKQTVAFTFDKAVINVVDEQGNEAGSSESSSSVPGTVATTGSKDPDASDPFDSGTSTTNKTTTTTTTTKKVVTTTKASVTLSTPVITAKAYSKNAVKISWKKVKNAKKYQVYRAKNSGSYKLIKTVTGTSYKDKTAKGSAKYKYKVRAVNGKVYKTSKAKSVSMMSFTAKVKVTASPLKAASKKPTATAKVKLSKKIKYASGYQIAYSTSSKFKKSTTKYSYLKAKNSTATLKRLKGKTKYYVRVRAYQTIGGKRVYGKWSTVKSVKTK